MTSGILYIIPTPLGNLEDITLRALRILKEVDFICAEDTRHSRKLLNYFGIESKCISYYREKEREKTPNILKLLKEGRNIALISDAGTPAISDPGTVLVKAAHKADLRVVPLPGATAVTTAVSASGICENGYLFLGFPPAKQGARRRFLQEVIHQKQPIVLYESPRRIQSLLLDALEIFGEREAFWARELTKSYEELQLSSLATLLEMSQSEVRGEFVLIISPGQEENPQGEDIEGLLVWYRDNTEVTVRDVSKKISKDLGVSRSEVYQLALQLWDMKENRK